MNLKQLYHSFFNLLVCGIILQSCSENGLNRQAKTAQIENDSINVWIKASKDKAYSINERKQFLLKSFEALKSAEIDTARVRRLSTLAYQNLKLGDTSKFKKQNKEVLNIAKKLKDTFAIADVHWNYATHYVDKQVYDSAYYHFYLAYSNFEKNANIYESAKTQYGMAFVKGRLKDYSGSEVLIFRAIEKFKKIKDYKSLFSCYNYLGQLQKGIKDFDRALFYYNKSSEYIKKLENNQSMIEVNLNNIANVYVEQKEYQKALDYYNRILNNRNLKIQDIESYARVIDNIAYCKLLMRDTINVAKSLKEALHIRDSIENKTGIIATKTNLAKYYAYIKDTATAIRFAKEANTLSKEIKNGEEYLQTLSLLSELDVNNTDQYLKTHIRFNDSLQLVERKTQNKFIRIEFETDEYIQENERLAEQKIWIITSSFALVLIIGLLFYNNRQKSKNEKLALENEQQAANEQVYLLTLRQQEKFEKEKVKERNRIAEELHDGILGKLFGTRVGLGFLDIKGDEKIKEQHETFLEELQTIEQEIREVSHKLSDNFDSSKISFTNIIKQQLESKSKIGNFKYEFKFDEHIHWQRINEKIKVNLFRIIQEATQNSIKHASAKNLIISFKLKAKHLVLTIKDDGLGFKVKQKNKGIGIKNMKSRVEKLNGEIDIHSILNKGTRITIQIPIK